MTASKVKLKSIWYDQTKLDPDVLDTFPAEFQTKIASHFLNFFALRTAGLLMLPFFCAMVIAIIYGQLGLVILFAILAYVVVAMEARKLKRSPLRLMFVELPSFVLEQFLTVLIDLLSGALQVGRILSSAFRPVASGIDVPRASSSDEFLSNSSSAVRVAHFSDLHLTRNTHTLTCERRSSPNNNLQELINKHLNLLRKCHFLVVTGDITDSGRTEEWNEFLRLVQPIFSDNTITELVVCPGNHDFNVTDGQEFFVAEREFMPARKLRLLRYFRMLGLVHKLNTARRMYPNIEHQLEYHERAMRWAIGESPCGPTLESMEADYIGGLGSIDTLAYGNFPCFSRSDTDIGQVIFDSNRPGGNIISNALGHIDRLQLKRFDRLKALFFKSDNQLNFAFIHHHLVRVPRAKIEGFPSRVVAAFKGGLMILLNSRKVVKILGQLPRVVVFHGHKHIYSRHVIDNGITVVSAPSTTLGCERTKLEPGFFVLAIQPAGDAACLVNECFCS